MKLVSKNRIDVIPGHNRFVPIEEVASFKEGTEAPVKEGCSIKMVGRNTVRVHNTTNKTYSIFEGDVIGEVAEEVGTVINTSPVQEAFAENKDGRYECPLCDKTYASEGWIKRHMEEEHNTVI